MSYYVYPDLDAPVRKIEFVRDFLNLLTNKQRAHLKKNSYHLAIVTRSGKPHLEVVSPGGSELRDRDIDEVWPDILRRLARHERRIMTMWVSDSENTDRWAFRATPSGKIFKMEMVERWKPYRPGGSDGT